MNRGNQAPLFAAENSYFEPPKSESYSNRNSPDRKNLTLDQSIEDYKLRGKVEGRAEKTMEQYDYVLGRLQENFQPDRQVRDITTKEMRKHFASLMD